MSSLHDFSGVLNGGGKVDFSRYAGHPCLVVNVASEWGVTDAEYKALTKLINDVSKQNNGNNLNYIYSMCFFTCGMKIAVKEIHANKKWQLGGFYFESQAITKGEGLKK